MKTKHILQEILDECNTPEQLASVVVDLVNLANTKGTLKYSPYSRVGCECNACINNDSKCEKSYEYPFGEITIYEALELLLQNEQISEYEIGDIIGSSVI